MTESNQQHLDRDVQGIRDAFATAIQELKDQIANGTPAAALDFSAADALLGTVQAEATADAPVAAGAADGTLPGDGTTPSA